MQAAPTPACRGKSLTCERRCVSTPHSGVYPGRSTEMAPGGAREILTREFRYVSDPYSDPDPQRNPPDESPAS